MATALPAPLAARSREALTANATETAAPVLVESPAPYRWSPRHAGLHLTRERCYRTRTVGGILTAAMTTAPSKMDPMITEKTIR